MEEIKTKIHECGLKATQQRIAIYKTMQKLGHASAENVVDNLKRKYPSITFATIYNVLESFVNCGLLVRRCSRNNKMYFDVNTYDHAHLYNMCDNTYEDYNDPELFKKIKAYLQSMDLGDFDLNSVELLLIGTKKKDGDIVNKKLKK
ncbi:MAG: transcriptional repressor [Bacteroidales bacterium]|jgi:Fur family peroxide stress response transcriptional regulator|nr:transcriptional repressor [Bacteroidales bacterium]